RKAVIQLVQPSRDGQRKKAATLHGRELHTRRCGLSVNRCWPRSGRFSLPRRGPPRSTCAARGWHLRAEIRRISVEGWPPRAIRVSMTLPDRTPLGEPAELLARAGRGDAAALGELFGLYRERLRRMVRLRMDRRMQGRLDASDVLQEAYLELAGS